MSVQSAEVIFYQNDVLLKCVFAKRTLSRGCVFRFSQEKILLPRDHKDTVLSQCNFTMNRRSAYVDVSVINIESDGSEGSHVTTPVVREIKDPLHFTLETGCETGKYLYRIFNIKVVLR